MKIHIVRHMFAVLTLKDGRFRVAEYTEEGDRLDDGKGPTFATRAEAVRVARLMAETWSSHNGCQVIRLDTEQAR